MITVITPTVRHEGLALVAKALKRQSFRGFEWLIVSPHEPDLITQGVGQDFTWLKDPGKNPGDYWSLNKAYNLALKAAQGDLIVSWQDYTYAKGDALERFQKHYEEHPNYLIGGVGNKYANEEWIVETWRDPRMRDDQGSFYPCYFADIEFNFCSIPLEAFYAVGGFDERLDKYAGMDGFSVVNRLHFLNAKAGMQVWDYFLDQSIRSYSLEHGRLPNWEEKNALGMVYANEFAPEYEQEPKLPYLTR